MNKYTTEKKYFKYFNSQGNLIKIKISKKLTFPTKITVKFLTLGAGIVNYHVPDKVFVSEAEAISYICENAEFANIYKIL